MKKINYFQDKEFYCKCGSCYKSTVSKELLRKLNKAREISQTPFIINSGVRCEKHNINVGGSPTSSHMLGLAADIRYTNSSECFKILNGLILAGFRRIGIYKNFIHADIDKNKVQGVIWCK